MVLSLRYRLASLGQAFQDLICDRYRSSRILETQGKVACLQEGRDLLEVKDRWRSSPFWKLWCHLGSKKTPKSKSWISRPATFAFYDRNPSDTHSSMLNILLRYSIDFLALSGYNTECCSYLTAASRRSSPQCSHKTSLWKSPWMN